MKTQNICLSWCTKQLLKVLALGNANAKCKEYLVFQAPKCIASRDAIAKYCKFFYNSATDRITLQHNSKRKTSILLCLSLSIHHYRINYSDWENIILLCRYIILMSRIEK